MLSGPNLKPSGVISTKVNQQTRMQNNDGDGFIGARANPSPSLKVGI